MGELEQRLAKKLAAARKQRIREEGISKLKAELKTEKSRAFNARFGKAISFAKSAGKSIAKAAAKEAAIQRKKKPIDFRF